jgi:molybdopterin molybdotransferase
MSRIADIATALPGYDAADLSVEAVHAFLSQLTQRAIVAQRESVTLFDALGRVLAEDIVSPISVPPHDNSAMDGYAFDGAVLPDDAPGDACVSLRVVGTALAGAAWRGALGAGDAVRIMTGAMMPAGLDTVIPQEFCNVAGDTVSFPAHALRRGANRRFAGEDLMQGQPALRKGERLSPAALGMVASLGLAGVPALRRLRVAYFSTGDEILSLGDAPREGAVYDSNRYTVFGLLTRLGCEVIDLGLVRDDPATLAATLQRAAREADAIVTSGGVSAGAADHTREVMQRLGDMAFWRVAMRPGRPLAVGLIPREPVQQTPAQPPAVLFGLPGNPVAVMVTFLAFVRPALLRMMGCHETACAPPPLLRARSTGPIRKKPGRTEYQRGFVRSVPGALPEVTVAGNQGSGVLSSMVEANGLVVLHHAQGPVAQGAEVDVMVFDGAI